ncbi:MAG: Smr/MutS family protein [Myxococcales bacterium]
MVDELLDKTLADLEWFRVEEAVAHERRAIFGGAGRLSLASTRQATASGLAETGEAIGLLRLNEPLPLDGIRDIGQALLRLERNGDLEVSVLNDVRLTLASARVLRKFLAARRVSLPALSTACPIDPSLDRLTATLDEAFDIDGTLADHASADLRRLRTETRNLRGHLVARLEELIHKHAELLSDRFYTLRDGRYVLPVRSDAHERVHGIVHGTSSSGSTIFVEPRSLVLSGNRLKLAEAEQEREEARVLGILSAEVRDEIASVRTAYEALLHADLRAACARLSHKLGLTKPVLAETSRIALREARHPVLALDGVEVVPNDVAAQGGHALVISGPNAGGKTVALKLLGLSALMVRAGLFLPADEGSECGFFDTILSDIGDEQSLSKNLSTFSAHIHHMRAILEVAGTSSLVLLDELAGSTDPEEGAALACAIVERLCVQGAAVAVTTHYEPLKAIATSDARMRNASVGFDVARMAPTFRLRLDAPGASSALRVAERFGLPKSVVERAVQIVPEQSKHFDQLVTRLNTRLAEVDARVGELQEEVRRAEQARRSLESELEKQKARDKRALAQEAQKVFEQLREARHDLERVKKELKQQRLQPDQLRELGQRLNELSSKVQEPGQAALAGSAPAEPITSQLSPNALAPGKRVYVPRLRNEVEIVEGPQKGRVRVAAGAMRLWVDVDELREIVDKQAADKPAERAKLGPSPVRLAPRSSDNSLDLRGMRVDDALSLLEGFLDRLYGSDEHLAFIEHGLGTGALKDAVRDYLARPSPYVESVRAGTHEEGGERITVVTLR